MCSLAALAWVTVSVTNQKHQETGMGHLCQFVWWHETHPKIFVAHPEHRSPEMHRAPALLILHDLLCLGVSSGVNHRNDVAADDQRPTHAPLSQFMCVSVNVLVFESVWLWKSQAENKENVLFLPLCVKYTIYVEMYSRWIFVFIVKYVGDAQVHWEWAENAAWGSTLCSMHKTIH